MNAMDELTLRLLTSKKKYNQYLATAMPDKSAEIQEFYNKIAKFRPRIQTMLGKYLDEPTTQTTMDVDDSVEQCLRTLIKHFEMRDYEDKCARKGYDETDSSEEEEVLFKDEAADEAAEEDDDRLDVANGLDKGYVANGLPKPHSYWGANISKQQTSLDMFVRRRKK
jgi:hypothetical protein